MVPIKRTRLHRAPVLALATPNSDWFYRLATYFGIQTWNILPVHIRNSENLELFKTSIRLYLFVEISYMYNCSQWRQYCIDVYIIINR